LPQEIAHRRTAAQVMLFAHHLVESLNLTDAVHDNYFYRRALLHCSLPDALCIKTKGTETG